METPDRIFAKNQVARMPPRGDHYKTNLERRMARRLELFVTAGLIPRWEYEPIKLRIAKRTWYKPDFMLFHYDGSVELMEVKGYHKNIRDSVTHWKAAAERYPFYRWTFLQWRERSWRGSAYYREDEVFLRALQLPSASQHVAELKRQSVLFVPPECLTPGQEGSDAPAPRRRS